MLDLKYLRQHAETVAQALAKKGHHFDIDQFTALDQARKSAETAEQQLLAERKQASKQVGVLIKQGVAVEDAKASPKAPAKKPARRARKEEGGGP